MSSISAFVIMHAEKEVDRQSQDMVCYVVSEATYEKSFCCKKIENKNNDETTGGLGQTTICLNFV